jgi:hypothetical protein
VSHFHVLRARTHLHRYRGHLILFLCFALPDMFLVLPSVSGHFFMFSVPELVLGGDEGVDSHFHILRSRTHFRRYR